MRRSGVCWENTGSSVFTLPVAGDVYKRQELVLNTAGTTEGTLGLVATNKLIFAGGIFTYGTGACLLYTSRCV